MNLIKLIDRLNLENIDEQEFLKPAMRRGLFKNAADYTLKAALGSAAFAAFALPKMAKAQGSTTIPEVLNFALALEYLERNFYQMGLNTPGLIPQTYRDAIDQIASHETAHVSFLLTALAGADEPEPTFDFTAGGAFATVFTDFATFITLAQAFEDTGVRAYKGQAGNVQSNDIVLTAALQIHAVEARHAAYIRTVRSDVSGTLIKPWVTNTNTNGLPAPIYAGEDNVVQGGVALSGITSLSAGLQTEAFDEPLTMAQVLSIVDPFIV